MKKKVLAIVLALVLALGMLMPAAAAVQFTDLEGHWAADYIRTWADKGVLNGYLDGTFRPDQYITRAEVAKVLALAYEMPLDVTGREFTDVESGYWYYSYVQACAANEIIVGDPDGSFRHRVLLMLHHQADPPITDITDGAETLPTLTVADHYFFAGLQPQNLGMLRVFPGQHHKIRLKIRRVYKKSRHIDHSKFTPAAISAARRWAYANCRGSIFSFTQRLAAMPMACPIASTVFITR